MIKEYQTKAINKKLAAINQCGGKIKFYKTWLILNKPALEMNGILYEIKDSSISLSSSVVIEDYYSNSFEKFDFHINEIETVKIRRNNNVGRGIWIGAVTGFGMGGLMGLLFGGNSYYPRGEVALYAATVSSLVGVGVGALIGAIHVKIPINGDIKTYNLHKNKLKKYSLYIEN